MEPKLPSEYEPELRTFLQSALAERAASSLSKGACVALHIGAQEFFFVRGRGQNLLLPQSATSPELHFWLTEDALRHLLELAQRPEASLPGMGVSVLECIWSSDASRKIRFRVDCGFLTLWRKGYFSVLKAGGPEVASYLARWGFGSLARFREVLKNIRG